MLARILVIATLVVAAGLFVAHAMMANAAGSGGTVPGWGYGDKNHVHTGPPGQSVHP